MPALEGKPHKKFQEQFEEDAKCNYETLLTNTLPATKNYTTAANTGGCIYNDILGGITLFRRTS